MALRDHFHKPLSQSHHWQSFHNAWATAMAWDLNRRLPEGYLAEPNVQFGIEIDVAAWEAAAVGAGTLPGGSAGDEAAGSTIAWRPPAPTQTVPFSITTDIVEVVVYNTEAGPTLVGAVELVSPANKDCPEHRSAFVAKCRAYLQEGIGLAVVDIVTRRRADLHLELLAAVGRSMTSTTEEGGPYAAAYRARGRDGTSNLEIWLEPLHLRAPLPTIPLWLRGGPCLPLDLKATNERACGEMRCPPA